MSADTHALLGRLVDQFASPYDFLRELVQNAIDAGSDRAEVELHQHRGDHDAEVVFELVFFDTGAGMDEEIIDGELTRLFGTSKLGDRTMAGGFGIGFVSVFAWRPERVLVQTGRRGEAWELLFHEDRSFEKRRVDMPVEGTTIRLFRRGAPAQRRAIAEAVEDALRRWCRFVPLEVTFEDVSAGQGPREISADFDPPEVAASARWEQGQSRAVLAFGPEPESVLMRRGLVLEEGPTAQALPALAAWARPETMEHLVARVDSPHLETGLARDGVVVSEAREALEGELRGVVERLREVLVERVGEVACRPGWTPAARDLYSHLHAHLHLEHEAIAGVEQRAILRLATGSAISIDALRRRAHLGLVAVADDGPLDLRLIALRSGVPVLHGRWALDRPWMEDLLQRFALSVRPLAEVVAHAEPVDTPPSLAALTLGLLEAARPSAIAWGRLEGVSPDVLGGVAVAESGVVTGAPWTAELLKDKVLWLQASHPIVRQASRTALARPEMAAFGLAAAISSRGDAPSDSLIAGWRTLA